MAGEYEAFEARFTVEVGNAITNIAKLRQEAEGLGGDYTKVAGVLGRVETSLSNVAGQEQTTARATNSAASAARQAQAAEEARVAGLSRTRYALYDVSTAAAVAGAALVAGFVLPANAAIQFEKAFAQVERTTGVTGLAAQQLKQDFIDLSTSIPVSFSQLSEIGTIAGQLGIAASGVDDFTSVIARFSATTDLSVDNAATSIGRLTQLLPDATGKYEQVASAILEVGVNSVASESQITAIATQLSGVAASANLATPDLIALSGALASVGTAPELSRGLVTRLFTNIQVAISTGGQKLEDFGRISGKTGEEFAAAWGSNKGQALLDLLNGINARGDDATQALNALGIASIRDVPALQRLAANTGIYSDALKQANAQFNEGTALAQQYGIIASTTSARIDVLGNSFQALLAGIGDSTTGFPDLIDFVTDLVKGFTEVVKNPVGATVAAIGLAMVALAGATGLAAAALTRGAATMIAFQQASLAAGASAGVATAGITALKVAMIATGIGAVIVTLGTIAATVLQMSGAFDTAKDSAESYFGTIDPIVQGLARDQESGAAAIQKISTAYEESSTSAQGWVSSIESATGAQVALGDGTETTTSQIRDQSTAYGENAKAALAAALANSEAFQELFANNSFDALAPIGGDATGFVNAILGDPVAGGTKYVDDLKATIQQRLTAGGLNINDFLLASGGNTANEAGAFKAYADALGVTEEQARGLATTIGQLQEASNASSGAVTGAAAELQAYGAVSAATGESLTGLAGGQADLGAGAEALGSQLQSMIDPIFETINAQYALQDATGALGEAFINQGAEVAFSGDAIQSTISAVLASAGSAPQAAAMLQGLFNSIVQGGYASAQQLGYLQQAIAALSGGAAVKAIPYNFSPFVSGAQKATQALGKKGLGGAAGGAAKEVRTLVDYGNDLAKVFDRSYDLRFGDQSAFDKISEKFNSIAAANEEARQAINDYQQDIRETQATINGLTADRRIQEYFLSIANAYGDSLRAQKITAKLADIDSDLADEHDNLSKTNKKLTDAQARQTKSTVGNSQAAIDNRSDLLDLVQTYDDYVAQLASSGLSQDELKSRVQQLQRDFINQATQLGYNQDEIAIYAQRFNDLTYAINNVPRNITVDANTDPAAQALQEFLDKANKSTASVGIGGAGDGYAAGEAYGESFGRAASDAIKTRLNAIRYRSDTLAPNQPDGVQLMGVYASGGFVPGATPGNRNVDNMLGSVKGGGMVGLQGGEPIMTNAARRYYGDSMFNAINRLQFPRFGLASGGFVPSAAPRPSAASAGPGGPSVVVLDAAQYAGLVRAMAEGGNIVLDGKLLTSVSNGVNQQFADLGNGGA